LTVDIYKSRASSLRDLHFALLVEKLVIEKYSDAVEITRDWRPRPMQSLYSLPRLYAREAHKSVGLYTN